MRNGNYGELVRWYRKSL